MCAHGYTLKFTCFEIITNRKKKIKYFNIFLCSIFVYLFNFFFFFFEEPAGFIFDKINFITIFILRIKKLTRFMKQNNFCYFY